MEPLKAAAKPADASWMWTLAYGYGDDRTPTHGYEPTREAAMAAFDARRRAFYRIQDRASGNWRPSGECLSELVFQFA